MQSTVYVFICITLICITTLCVYLIILAISAKKLVDNSNEIASSIKQEIEPTLKELKQAAKSINSIAANADTQLQNTKAGIASLLGATSCLSDKLKSFSKGILKGISFGLGLFRK